VPGVEDNASTTHESRRNLKMQKMCTKLSFLYQCLRRNTRTPPVRVCCMIHVTNCIFSYPLLISSLTMNQVFILRAKHHVFLSRIKATSGDIEDISLGKPYFNGGTMIPETDGGINICALLVGPYQLIVVCYDECFC
jgi:hypothetical protein